MGRFNVGEIGTGTNIHPKANMDDAIDNDKGDRDIDTCRQRQRIASPLRLASPLSMICYTAIATMGPLDEYECMYRSFEKYSKGTPLRAIFNVAEMGRFNVEEIGTGTNIRPKANMGDAIDNDKGDRDSDTCRQRQRIASPSR